MNVKRIFFVCVTVMALAVLLTFTVYAESWWNETSADVSAYPVSPPLARGDLDGNGSITASDLSLLKRMIAGCAN